MEASTTIRTLPVLTVSGMSKSFGPTHAIKNVSLGFHYGEVHGLVGENGSGKSTLLAMIAGIHKRDAGNMAKDGLEYDPQNPADANNRGVSIVVQELGLIDGLTVAENIFLGKTEQFSKHGILNVKKMYDAALEAFLAWGVRQKQLDSLAAKLTVEEKKLVELVRALSTNPDVLILDEITAALSHDNRAMLYDLLAKLKQAGKTILFVSHDLQEVIELCDRITVMKDGEVVTTIATHDVNEDELKRLMVGREINEVYHYTTPRKISTEPILIVENATIDGAFSEVSFTLRCGELLGLGGLSDSGIHELGKALCGLSKPDIGRVYLSKTSQEITSIQLAIESGIAYVPKDRDAEALMVDASIEDNLCLPSIDSFIGAFGFISPGKKREFAAKLLQVFQIKAEGITQAVNQLSGGNRQKVSLASWLARSNQVLILDSPTRGVDVGVKSNIYKLIAEAKNKGIAIILISDELPELIGCSDRLLIMKNGRMARMFQRSEGFSENQIIEVMI